MPRRNRRNRRFRRALDVPRRERPTRAIYPRDRCGKLAFPTYEAAARIAASARTAHQIADERHYIYRCYHGACWHLSSRTPSEVDARRAFYRHQREEASPR